MRKAFTLILLLALHSHSLFKTNGEENIDLKSASSVITNSQSEMPLESTLEPSTDILNTPFNKKIDSNLQPNTRGNIEGDGTTSLPNPTTDYNSRSERLLPPQSSQTPSQVVMSVWAKKAGGNYLSNTRSTQNSSPSKPEGDNKRESLEWNPKVIIITPEPEKSSESNENNVESSQPTTISTTTEENTFYDDYEEKEEEECPDETQFWHIRGERCVPLNCPGGNHRRNVETGECIISKLSSRWARKRYNMRRNNIYRVSYPGSCQSSSYSCYNNNGTFMSSPFFLVLSLNLQLLFTMTMIL